jgi:hypothetical protein
MRLARCCFAEDVGLVSASEGAADASRADSDVTVCAGAGLGVAAPGVAALAAASSAGGGFVWFTAVSFVCLVSLFWVAEAAADSAAGGAICSGIPAGWCACTFGGSGFGLAGAGAAAGAGGAL